MDTALKDKLLRLAGMERILDSELNRQKSFEAVRREWRTLRTETLNMVGEKYGDLLVYLSLSGLLTVLFAEQPGNYDKPFVEFEIAGVSIPPNNDQGIVFSSQSTLGGSCRLPQELVDWNAEE